MVPVCERLIEMIALLQHIEIIARLLQEVTLYIELLQRWYRREQDRQEVSAVGQSLVKDRVKLKAGGTYSFSGIQSSAF